MVQREVRLIILDVEKPCALEMLEIVDATDAERFGLGMVEGGAKKANQDHDDRDHRGQLDQGKTARPAGRTAAG